MIYFYIIIFILSISDTIAGFGSTTIGIPILALAVGTEKALLLMATAVLVVFSIIFFAEFKKIVWRELLIILLCILPIMPLGFLLYSKLRAFEWVLRLTTGILVTFVSGREIWRRWIKKDLSEPPRWYAFFSLGIGALAQGMLSMGGALINVYTMNRLKDKGAFRATMATVWLVTNTISMLYRMLVLRAYTVEIWKAISFSIPLVILAFFIGNALHRKIPDKTFVNIVYSIQLLSGLMAIVSGLSLVL